MKIHSYCLKIKTSKRLEILDLTKKISDFLIKSKLRNGFVNIFSKHTTLGLKINELEPLLLKDMYLFLEKIAPKEKNYFHDKIELRKNCPLNEPKNADSHLKCLFLETSQMVPFKDFKLDLGTWQKIIAIETSGPRKREVLVQLIGEI